MRKRTLNRLRSVIRAASINTGGNERIPSETKKKNRGERLSPRSHTAKGALRMKRVTLFAALVTIS